MFWPLDTSFPFEWLLTGRWKRLRFPRLSVFGAEFACNVLLAVAFFALAMAGYYFLIASLVEGWAVRANTDRVVSALGEPVRKLLTADQKRAIGNALRDHLATPDMSEEDARAAASNAKIRGKAIVELCTGGAAAIFVVFAIWLGMRGLDPGKSRLPGRDYPDLAHIVRDVSYLTLFVFAAELLFLFLIVWNWQSVDVEHLRLTMVDTLIRFLKGETRP